MATRSPKQVSPRAFTALARSPSGRYFEKPIYTAIASAALLAPSGATVALADVVSRTADCAQLVFVAGHCPARPGTVAMSRRSAAYLHVRLGTVLVTSLAGSTRHLQVSGFYAAGSVSSSYWWGQDYFEFGTNLSPPPRIDALFSSPATLDALPGKQVALSADVGVDTRALKSSQLPAFRRALRAEEVRLGKRGLLASSGIVAYLDEVATQQQAMTTTIAVIDLQLLLLVLMVIFGIAGRIAAERDQDLALANLRGLSPRSLWAVALREPFVLTIAAAPLGAVLGWLVALATARAELLAGTPVPFDSLGPGRRRRRRARCAHRHRRRLAPGARPLYRARWPRAITRRHGADARRRSLRHRPRPCCSRAGLRLRGGDQGKFPAPGRRSPPA